MNGIIVGIDVINQAKAYRIIFYKHEGNDWQFNKQLMHESDLINAMVSRSITLDNAIIDNGAIKGSTGDLNRFNAKGFHPMVIISEMVADDQIIGYKLASYEGKISNVRIKDVIAYCNRIGSNGAPIQNAMYVAATDTQKAHIRAYPGQTFNKEIITRQKVPTAAPADVSKRDNNKQLSKIEELFTKDQIEQLKLGKEHGVDIRVYGNNKLSAKQMKELRLALENGVNPMPFADPAFTPDAMKALRIQAKYGVNISTFVNPRYNAAQIYELSTGYLSGVNIKDYADPDMSATDMSKKRVYLESKLWIEVEAEDKR